MDVGEDPMERKRRLARERKARWRAKQSQETLAKINAEKRRKLELETEEHAAARQEANAASQRNRIALETPSQKQARLTANSSSYQAAQKRISQAIQDVASNFDEANVDQHHCGPFDAMCQFCASRNFAAERPADKKFTSCCRKGRVKLPKPTNVGGTVLPYPTFLQQLLSDPTHPKYRHFRDKIRSYNNAISFASMGAKIIDFPGRGPYVFKIHGQTCHQTSHTLPVNDQAPQYAQLYVLDTTTQATDVRQQHQANEDCRQEIMYQLDRFFRDNNRLAQCYQLMHEIESREAQNAAQLGLTIPTVSMAFYRDRQSDQRRYNAPTSNEIAMVFVNEDGEPPFERDIHIYPKNPQDPNQAFIKLHILSPNMDPMTYAIMFPYGEAGWQPYWQCESYEGATLAEKRRNVSMLQFKAALTAIRDDFSPIMSAGKLTQQWLVDSYLQVEANNLNYIRQNQKRIRTEQYQGLADHMANLAENQNVAAGVSIILPSSFEGSPRNMRERCCDAMSIFAKWGAPDVFITFTANPSWPEIVANLRPGEQTCDRPDLVARVFKLKLDSLMEDITKHGIFGQCLAFVYSIEFQKRGLPHAHILVTLRVEDKFTMAHRIDQYVSAEIPPESSPRLREIVTLCMMHGPCGSANLQAPCMVNGSCSKNFPKEFNANTIPNASGYPVYRRRNNERATVRGVQMDSRNVVPYNPYLTLKYNAHINVEVCTSLHAIKYIYKYIFKGFDCANISIRSDGNPELRYDELSNYISCRYVSAPEAMWRLRESPMHDRSHAVMRLNVHLPNQQTVVFEAGHEEEALLAAQTGKTKLERWFSLNENDEEARQWLYTDIPYHYTFTKGHWQQRKRGGNNVVSRMYTVGIKDEERFYLRMLLLHVRGATSFDFLRTVDAVVYETFKAAASARGLLESDDEWANCLRDGATYLMPKQLREMFAYICVFCIPADAPKLWEDHLPDMILDYARRDPEPIAINKALHNINAIFKQHGKSCSKFKLPEPTGNFTDDTPAYDAVEEAREGAERIALLNDQQLSAFNQIIAAVDDVNATQRCFYIDGPGGSGKTFLYTTLMSFIRGRNQSVLPFATTGIAATLLKGGRTVHSGFKLPVPLLDTSVSLMRLTSTEAQILQEASLILMDEITMLPKHGLRCIDKLLREIMDVNLPFGGKVLVIGGDFRQTLPVVPRGTRTDIIECCIKTSRLWRHFKQLTLVTNMRSEGQNAHNQWLLQVGSGNLEPVSGLFDEDAIQIPQQMVSTHDLIETIFANVQQMPLEELSKRVIVAPTNAQTLAMNRKIIEMLAGDPMIYYSADSLSSEDPSDNLNFPTEFLNELTPSGMPPHVLLLKKGTIIMLLRNLNPKKGMCNGTRLIVEELARNFIKARIISECNRGDLVLIPRIDLAPTDTVLPFTFKRRQFPITPAYTITINKSQGQTFDHVGVNLQTAVFSHGMLYVALSRSRDARNIKVHVESNSYQGQLLNDLRVFTRNVVFKEIL